MKYRGALHHPCHLQICHPETLNHSQNTFHECHIDENSDYKMSPLGESH